MNGYGSHTFKSANEQGQACYVKCHFKTDQEIRNLQVDLAGALAGSDPNDAIQDLYNAIAIGAFPSLTLYVQIMTYNQATKYQLNPFDLPKIWPHADYYLQPGGRLVFNRNPTNYFVEVV